MAPTAATVQVHRRGKNTIFICAGHDRIISFGIPSDIIDTHNTTNIIDTLGTIGVFPLAPFGIVDILDASDYTWSSTRRRSSSGESPRHLCTSHPCIGSINKEALCAAPPKSACPQPEPNATELPSCAPISARATQRRRRRWWRGEEGARRPGPEGQVLRHVL